MKPPAGRSKALALLWLLSMVLLLCLARPRAQAAAPQQEKIVIVQQGSRDTQTVRVYRQEQPNERLQCRRVWQEDRCRQTDSGKA